MHIVQKQSSTTTRIRAVFDASAKSMTGVSFNDTLLVGPTIHSSLIDVLIRFRLHKIALTTDVSRMYRAVELVKSDRDFHRFVWRSDPTKSLQDYRMTRITFGVSASSFAANMAVCQNAINNASEFPQAAESVLKSFYVDDGLTGADSVDEGINLQQQLQKLFAKGGFLLRKWNSNIPSVINQVPPELRDSNDVLSITDSPGYTKTLGVEWNSRADQFRITVSQLPQHDKMTKREFVSDIAKTYDVLGWFSPTIIKSKILLQRIWEAGIDWDEEIPQHVFEDWSRWRSELGCLSEKLIERCYFPNDAVVKDIQLHGFCDASEEAFAGVVYIRFTSSNDRTSTSLVMAKTKVAPIKRITIPRLELCGAHLLAKLLHHVGKVLNISSQNTFAWTDSTIVLDWLKGNPRRFKQFVGNRISLMIDLLPPERWKHVKGIDNPADCASRGMFPTDLIKHDLWWHGPKWLTLNSSEWPIGHQNKHEDNSIPELCHHSSTKSPIIPL
jgi:hypothetical protein